MLAFAAGDSAPFKFLYQGYRQALYSFIKRQLPNDSIDELLQNVLKSVISTAEHYQATAKFQSFLYTTCRNIMIDFWRIKKQHQTFDEEQIDENTDAQPNVSVVVNSVRSIDDELGVSQRNTELHQAITNLPASQKEAFLFKGAGFSVHDISVITGIDFETAKSRLKLRFRTLRAQLKTMRSDL